ncbi:MAG: PqqD family peptide modification chaperone [Anaerolineae bacterium]|nr:PqqD family peptide modification chaperone [Anaerolineae bacterium]
MHPRYRLKPTLVAQPFEDGALLLDTATRRLVNLNHSAYQIVMLTDGAHSVAQIAQSLAATYDIAASDARSDVIAFYELLATHNLVEQIEPTLAKDHSMSEATRYIRNPDVGIREENEDGALLFEPDSGQVKVINPTGLFIWKLCDGNSTLDEIISAVLGEFEDAPVDAVTDDVTNFVTIMFDAGFLGIIEFKQKG